MVALVFEPGQHGFRNHVPLPHVALAAWKCEERRTRMWISPRDIVNMLRDSVPCLFGEGVGRGQELPAGAKK